MKKNILPHFLFASAVLLSYSVANAHGAWVAENAGNPTIIYGHGGDNDDYEPNRITMVNGFDAEHNAVNVERKNTDRNVYLEMPDSVAYLGVVFDNGYWTKDTAGEWHNHPKDEVDNAKSAGRYIKNAISIMSNVDVIEPIEGLDLQVIPQSNPLVLKAGEELTVQVLFHGEPLADAEITGDYVNMSHVVSATTDADGKATFAIRNQGLNVISVSHSEELKDDPKADKVGYASTLAFTLEHMHKH